MGTVRVPLPREHGAWAMVVGPALVGLAARPAGRPDAEFLADSAGLLVALLALFCLQHVVLRRLTSRRADPGWKEWALLFGTVGLASGATLVLLRGHLTLIGAALLAVLYFAIHVVQVRRPGRREHRALGFELLTVAVLCLGAPAGAVVAGASLGRDAAWAYGLSFAFFAGSVFHVRAIVRRLKLRARPDEPISRLRLARESVAWHLLLGLAIGFAPFWSGRAGGDPPPVGFLAVAFVPAVVRALWTVLRLRRSTWSLRAVGLVELGCTLAFLAGAMSLLALGLGR